MICQICSKNEATIHVTEIQYVHAQSQPGAVETNADAPQAPNGSQESPDGSPDESPDESPEKSIEQKHLCETCAQGMHLPHAPIVAGMPGMAGNLAKGGLNIWKLLQSSARRARQEGSLVCPDCGMTLADFRAKGRLGCPRDYEIFKDHLTPLLRRVHNADVHRGRLPGVEASENAVHSQLHTLRAQLEKAIAEEAYENAARLRDAIQALEIEEDPTH